MFLWPSWKLDLFLIVKQSMDFKYFNPVKSEVKVKVTLRLRVSQLVSLGVEPHDQIFITV
jgi:hypothetical protein